MAIQLPRRHQTNPNRPWRPGRSVSIAAVSDGLVVVDERRGRTVHLNTTAAAMLQALLVDGQEGAITVVCWRFGVTETAARADLATLITDLVRRKLVRQ